ncbi:MAG: four helix bundle protein [Crocinitomicaceae bacterium]|jgi:four helix bundle protein|nr:four helix bundle protein [Crocinitomicaceae bacterium]MBK6950735.1 four helix bundle protein [Crocinitomicaceae bacterium]MBK9592464.1 four helix bundle protein [Crocinitomicaceae bacterium]
MNNGVEDLIVYKKAYALAMRIFDLSKTFPVEEKYSLTDQIRRASRSVCSNLAEGYRKRLYPKHFISKISDSDAESAETIVWLNFSRDCKYLSGEIVEELKQEYKQVGKLLGDMINYPEKYAPKGVKVS